MRLLTLFSLLFLTAALHLDAQQKPEPVKCLTPYLLDRHSHPEKQDARLEALASRTQAVRQSMQRELVSSGGHFRVHYDVAGNDAVSTTDANSNSVPDFIDSVDFYLEYAWKVQIDEMGYLAPSDLGIQGPEIDVFVAELAGDYYGMAFPEYENEISSEPPRVTGYLVLDNDYRNYPTEGIDGLRVTAAHELHHIVQFSSYRSDFAQASLYESTSTWMEKRVHPSLHDYRYYIDLFLSTPQIFPYSTHEIDNLGTGYGHVLYHDYLTRRLDEQVVLRFWQEFALEEHSFTAIDNVLKRSGALDLERSWCEFALWCYFTGKRAPLDSSLFVEARTLPTMKSFHNSPLDQGQTTVLAGELQPLAFVLERVILRGGQSTSDTLDFLITNARSDIGKGGSSLPFESYTLTVATVPADGYLPIKRSDSTIAWYSLVTDIEHVCIRSIVNGVRDVTLGVTPGLYEQTPSGSSRRPTLRFRR